MNPNNFEFLYIIGRGGFGKVWKVKSKKTKKCYALKQMSKVKVIDKKSIKSINSERELLSKLYHPFLVNMHYAFQDNKYLYLVMDLLTGGDLRYHISIHKKFSEEQTRFFICGITLSLEYIHSNNIIHRDIKPENLVLDENGYIRLTDFGIAKINMPDNSSETSGTPGYMSPEVMKSLNHSFPVDYFALGVIGYEFMKGERPYNGRNRKEIKEQILSVQAEIKKEEIINENWSKESINFINRLLMRKPEERLGYKGIEELKDHPWLRYYPWDSIKDKSLPSPFVPQNKDNFDSKYCKSIEYIGEETRIRYEEILSDDNYEFYFKNFYYNIDEDKKRCNDILSYNKNKNKNRSKKINDKNIKSGKENNNLKNINKIYNFLHKINNTPNEKNRKFMKSKKENYKSKESNLILINFNINNITNNNIKNKINNFFVNKNKNNNITAEGNKRFGRKSNSNHRRKKTNVSNLGLIDFKLNRTNSPLNSSNKIKYKCINNSKSKNKEFKSNYFYNNSLIKKLTKVNLSQVRLLKNKNKKNNKYNNLNIDKYIHKTNSQIISISYSHRDKDNKSINSLNEDINSNSSRNKIIIDKNKLKNSSMKKISSIQNLKSKINRSKKIIFNKKILTNNNINKINSKKIIKFKKNNIPISSIINCESFNRKEKNRTIQNKSEIIKRIISVFKKSKKNNAPSHHHKRCISNNLNKNNIMNNINKKINSINPNLDNENSLGYNSERIKNRKPYNFK